MAGFLFEIWKSLTDPDRLIHLLAQVVTGWFGYALLAGVVFAETGLLIGLFLPGDSLLFTVGVVAGAGELNIVQICLVLAIASILGDQCGYLLGRRTGPAIFSRPDSRWFKQEYVTRTQRFYERHGGKTLIYAKFVPVVRAFAPYMAGVGRMSYVRFLSFNVWGGLGWVLSMTLGGYALGNYPFIRRNFEKVVLGIVFVSIVPLIVQILHSRRAGGVQDGTPAASPEPVPEIPE
jgi:membrane-associated protein